MSPEGARKQSYTDLKLPQISPCVQFVAVFIPSITDVVTVIHIWDHDIANAVVDLRLSLLHGLSGADNDERNA